jgi:hypothetical protein
MIFGITHQDKNRHVNKEAFLNLVPARLAGKAVSSFIQLNIALGTSEMTVPTINEIEIDPTPFATVYFDCLNKNTVTDCVGSELVFDFI